MRAQRGGQRGAAMGVEDGLSGVTRHHGGSHAGADIEFDHDDPRLAHQRRGSQPLLDLRQRDTLFLDLDDAVGAAGQHEAVIPGRQRAVRADIPAVIGQMRRAHGQEAVLQAPGDAGQRGPAVCLHGALAPGDAAGLGAAEYLDGRAAGVAQRVGGGLGRERPAGREHRLQHGARGGPVKPVGHPLQVRRAADQHRRAGVARAGAHQFLMEGQPRAGHRPSCRQRPEHREQQAVDVLVRDRAQHAHIGGQARAEGLLERVDLGIELGQALVDGPGLARGAGGEQRHPRVVRAERGPAGLPFPGH
ncbi:hypothetical protein D3C87_1322740 [compost metagenome]